MNWDTLELEVEGKIAVLSLNRPPVNALNRKLFEELYEALDYVERQDGIKALIVAGKGEKAFAAGADITEMTGLDAEGMAQMNAVSRRAFERLENLTKPTIAAVNGLALGGGCELALCCDFRICSENARFGLPEITLAIIPGGGGTQRLQRLIGQAKAKELLYFGEMIGAADAVACGLANKAVPPAELLDACKEWAAKLAAKPAVAMRMMKAAVNAGADTDLKSALTLEAACFGTVFSTYDRQEGMNAFVEKRKPVYLDK
jgi:enoyl-CoA hydratase